MQWRSQCAMTRCGKNRSKNLGGRSANICDLRGRKCRYFWVLFGCGFCSQICCKYLRPIFARKFVKKVANMGYLPHLRPHLQAKNDLLPANLLSACKSSSFFAESEIAAARNGGENRNVEDLFDLKSFLSSCPGQQPEYVVRSKKILNISPLWSVCCDESLATTDSSWDRD